MYYKYLYVVGFSCMYFENGFDAVIVLRCICLFEFQEKSKLVSNSFRLFAQTKLSKWVWFGC